MSEFRVEKDSMGEVQVPAQAYYSAQTQRAVENFPISGWPLPKPLIHAMGLVKYAAAVANRDLGKLTGSGKNPLTDQQVKSLRFVDGEIGAAEFLPVEEVLARLPHRLARRIKAAHAALDDGVPAALVDGEPHSPAGPSRPEAR